MLAPLLKLHDLMLSQSSFRVLKILYQVESASVIILYLTPNSQISYRNIIDYKILISDKYTVRLILFLTILIYSFCNFFILFCIFYSVSYSILLINSQFCPILYSVLSCILFYSILFAILLYSISFSILSILSCKIPNFVNIFLHSIVKFKLIKTQLRIIK